MHSFRCKFVLVWKGVLCRVAKAKECGEREREKGGVGVDGSRNYSVETRQDSNSVGKPSAFQQ